MAATYPIIQVKNVVATGAWQTFQLPKGWNSFVIQARTAVDVRIKAATGAGYFTVKSGTAYSIQCYNQTDAFIRLFAAVNTVIEISGQIIT